ncbi:TerD family protein [uncultured Thiodictyon sp.]|uniref:TerD family protein n=1 Tax=uncultured Thiodictyon sp. TaxID=1846217 RepID=UPI0025FD9389|nr:TerD family protein [uncultured Thiodictyon sp.]
MPVNLTKGGNVSLTKEAPGISKIRFGLGWDARSTDGAAFDLDAVAVVVGADGKVLSQPYFVFFNNLATPDKSVVHQGDNRTGEGEGDDEVIAVDLPKLPAESAKVVFAATIYEADTRKQNFGQVANAYIRAVDEATGAEVMRFDLSEDFSTETSLVFGELYRREAEWKFKAIGAGYADGLAGLVRDYGV